MTVKDIIKLACEFLGKEDLLEYECLDGETLTVSEADQKEIDRLIRCLNLVNSSIASDYIPLIHEEVLTVEDEKIVYANLTKTMLEIIELKDDFDNKLRFKLFPTYAKTCNGKQKVFYSYLPVAKTDLADVMDDYYGRLSERVFAYGVAMEYALISSLFDESALYEKRFKDSLFVAMRKRGETKLPKRGWF